MRFLLSTFILLSPFLAILSVEDNDNDHGHGEDPFDKILTVFNINASHFTADRLQGLVDHFSERFECDAENQPATPTCDLPFCLNTSKLLDALGVGSSAVITEEIFENISIILVSIVTDLNQTCHSHISLTPQTISNVQRNFSQLFGAYMSPGGLAVNDVQLFLEALPLADHVEEDGDHMDDHADEDHIDDHAEETNSSTGSMVNTDDEHDEHDEHGEEEVFMDQCLGADVIFDQLELELSQTLPEDEFGHMVMLLVYHILTGSTVSRDCRFLPRQEFFSASIFQEHGAINGTITRTAFAEIMAELQIGKKQTTGHDDTEDDHAHRRKRSAGTYDFSFKESWGETCYISDQLLAVFEIGGDVSLGQFNQLCPALVQQKLSKACETENMEDETVKDQPSLSQRYGYGTIATFIVCVSSAIGALVVRCGSQKFQNGLMNLFVGLAVGTLFGDAIIHLIPQALGVHGHDEEDGHDHSEDEGIVVEPYVWYSMVICGGLYLFYWLELLSSLLSCCKTGISSHSHAHSMDGPEETEVQVHQNGSKYEVSGKTRDQSFSSLDSERASTDSNSLTCGLAPVAYMVLIGDGVHNLVDGLAIGASFSSSVTLGVSTSIAVLCHEVPHELGDFAILLKTGVPFWRALLFNFLSSLTAMVGFYIGVAISSDHEADRWILAVVAGMFIYISLVSMLPAMLKESKSSLQNIVISNVGMLLGLAIMVLLAVFEEQIEI